MESFRIGSVLGTQPATALQFWVAVDPEAAVGLDDLVYLETESAAGTVRFYGSVDEVRKIHEGVHFESDTADVVSGLIPAVISYTAHVLVTRIEPEEFIPPNPGDAVWRASGADLERALFADRMERRLPAGVLRSGEPAWLNFDFINGTAGAHVNISGISGVATKTSYALFLLYAIFHSQVLGAEASNSRAIVFNVKGEDLLFLDQPNALAERREAETFRARGLAGSRYQRCGLPTGPFRSVRFLAPPRPGPVGGPLIPHVEQRQAGVGTYLWTLRDFCRDRLLPFCLSERETSLNLSYLVGHLAERLARLAEADGGGQAPYLLIREEDFAAAEPQPGDDFEQLGRNTLSSLAQLVDFLEFKLLRQDDGRGDPRWTSSQNSATLQALIRRLRGVSRHLAPLVRGDVSAAAAQRHRLQLLAGESQLSVIDIHQLHSQAQMFVVGVTLHQLFEYKERFGQRPYVFIALDELNKYAPSEGDSPIKDVLLDIAERGRSLGIILIGAQQTASEVERRITGNAAIRVVGRLDPAEAERPEYRFLSRSYRERAAVLQPGSMLVRQPEVPTPLLVTFPFPAWATRLSETGTSADEEAARASDLLS